MRRIALGGMAEIFLATSKGIGGFEKLVVLKKILPEKAADSRFIKMFLNEAKLAAQLDHPNIAHVSDIGEENGTYFFAMEYVHGADLRAVLRRAAGPLPFEHALAIAAGVASGLHYAHEMRSPDGRALHIVHRDVSPSNILVSYSGGVKLVDFGVAKASSSVSQTRVGILKGKYEYMSPEQCQGLPLDRRSDIFAVGVLLWEMTTGRRLFNADNKLDILDIIVRDPIPKPSRFRTPFPEALERLILKALERNRDRRYPTAQHLQLELEDVALQHRLPLSAIHLARYLEEKFADEIEAWHKAEETGVSLVDHVAGTIEIDLEEKPTDRSGAGMPETRPESVVASDAETPRPPRLPARPRASRNLPPAWVWTGGLGLGCVLGGVILLSSRDEPRTLPRPDVPALAAAPAEAEPAPAEPDVTMPPDVVKKRKDRDRDREREKAEREREKAEKAEKAERAEREKAEREREKAEKAEREKAEKAEKAEREKAEKAEREKEKRAKAKARRERPVASAPPEEKPKEEKPKEEKPLPDDFDKNAAFPP